MTKTKILAYDKKPVRVEFRTTKELKRWVAEKAEELNMSDSMLLNLLLMWAKNKSLELTELVDVVLNKVDKQKP